MPRYKDKKDQILFIVREMISREASSAEEAEEFTRYITYHLRGTQWKRRKDMMKVPGLSATTEAITYYEQQLATLHNACSRARFLGLPASLAIEQWLKTVEYFNQKCAYCLVGSYQVLEHFIPLGLKYPESGTTVWNCIPACRSCNTKKRSIHPDLVTTIPKEHIERVREYLTSFQKS